MSDSAAASAPSPAKKVVKAKESKIVPAHPPVSTMFSAAIAGLKDRKGSSLSAIKKYIDVNNKNVDSTKLASFIKRYLKSAVAAGKLIQTKGTGATGSFKLGKEEKPEKEVKKAALKEVKKATLKEVKKATLKEVKKAALKEVKTAALKEVKKAELKEVKKPKATLKKVKKPKAAVKKPAAKNVKSPKKATKPAKKPKSPKKAVKKPAAKKAPATPKAKKPAAKKTQAKE